MYLFAFDMDGTLTYNYSWYDLVREFGDEETSKKLKEKYYNGEISYDEWVDREITILRSNNLHREDILRIMSSYSLVDGLEDFVMYLKEKMNNPVYLTIISSGIIERASTIARQLNFNSYYGASFKYTKEGYLIGMKNIMRPEHKKDILTRLIHRYGPKKVIVIGDSDFDIPMMELADLKISVNNKIEDHEVDYHGENYYEIKKFLKQIL